MSGFYLWTCGIPVAVVAVAILWRSAYDRRRAELLETTGRHTFGVVVDTGSSSDGLGSDSYWVKVRYDYDGGTITTDVGVSRENLPLYPVGKRVGLTFAEGRPKVVQLDGPQW
jgi:hypothetical protein